MPAAIDRVLSFVRRLIAMGKDLAGKLHQRAAAPDFDLFARRFGTTDVAAILARITAGLRRAALLEAALRRRATRGKDLAPATIRLPAVREPGPAQQAASPESPPELHAEDPLLWRLPTEEEIAAEVRRRPVGAVIADICRDLGIRPGELDRPFWEELSYAIIVYGGNLLCFLPKLNRRLFDFASCGLAAAGQNGSPAAPPLLSEPATGPP